MAGSNSSAWCWATRRACSTSELNFIGGVKLSTAEHATRLGAAASVVTRAPDTMGQWLMAQRSRHGVWHLDAAPQGLEHRCSPPQPFKELRLPFLHQPQQAAHGDASWQSRKQTSHTLLRT